MSIAFWAFFVISNVYWANGKKTQAWCFLFAAVAVGIVDTLLQVLPSIQ